MENVRLKNEKESVQDRMVSILGRLVVEQPDLPFDYLMLMNEYVKNGSFALNTKEVLGRKQKVGKHLYSGLKGGDVKLDELEWAEKLLLQIKPPEPEKKKKNDDDEEEEEEEPEEEGEEGAFSMEDVIGQCQLLSQGGVGFSEDEIYRIFISLKRFADSHKDFSTMRFFGKIFGTIRDYYIVEVELKKSEDEEEAEEEEEGEDKKPKIDPNIIPPETKGKGTNRFVYYVCNRLDAEWELLPDTTPDHIKAARDIKKFFTGDLDSELNSHPPFPGTEREYLRAQIARISSGAVLAPKGLMAVDAEDEEEEEEDEDAPKKEKPIVQINAYKNLPGIKKAEKFATIDLASKDNWVHIHPEILHEQNRCEWYRPGNDDEEEEEEEEDDENPKPEEHIEKVWPLLTPISKENESEPSIPSWTSRKLSNTANFTLLRSTRWPGAYTLGKIDQRDNLSFCNIYIGHGAKFSANGYTPNFTLDIQNEANAIPEQTDAESELMATFERPPPPEPPVKEEAGEGEEAGEDGEKPGEDAEEEDD